MKKLFNITIQITLIILLSGCSSSENNVPNSDSTDNQLADITIDIIDITDTYINVSVYGGDDDGVKRVDTYLIDMYRLNLFEEDNQTVYVMDKSTQVFNETQDKVFDFNEKFYNIYPNKQYIIRSVAYTVNGMSVIEEKVSTSHNVRTSTATVVTTPPVVIRPEAVTSQDRTVVKGQNIALSGAKSTDADGNIVSYIWYSESGEVLSRSISFLHVINTVGVHVITLVVEDNDGAKGSDTVTINVTL